MSSPLAQIGRKELEFLDKKIRKGLLKTPITEVALQSMGKAKLYARLGALIGAPREAALALIEMALAEPPAHVAKASASLVWTGPTVNGSKARTTTSLIIELLGKARESVLIAGYEFNHGSILFEPLHRVMQEHGVDARIFVDVRPASSKANLSSHLALFASSFLKTNWPFGEPAPQIYHYGAGVAFGSHRSLHAKCIVVDRRYALVGSANFTKRGTTRNVEVGIHTDDPVFAVSLVEQFERLVDRGEFAPLPASLAPAQIPPEEAEAEEGIAGDVAVDHAQLARELFVSPEACPLFMSLLDEGVSPPNVGDDIENEGGDVLGSAEFSWLEQRVAVLLPEQQGCRKRLEVGGWTCFSLAMNAEELEMLRDLVEREG